MMNKTKLVEIIAEKEGLPKAQADRILNILTTGIADSVAAGEKVTILGFGTFEATSRVARSGVNPATGEKISIPASNGVKFKAGKAFKEAVNK